jgi:hypothetical protein
VHENESSMAQSFAVTILKVCGLLQLGLQLPAASFGQPGRSSLLGMSLLEAVSGTGG